MIAFLGAAKLENVTHLLNRRDIQKEELQIAHGRRSASLQDASAQSLTLAWYPSRAVTGQNTRIAMLNAMALPTPCEVASACRNVKWNRLVVSSHK